MISRFVLKELSIFHHHFIEPQTGVSSLKSGNDANASSGVDDQGASTLGPVRAKPPAAGGNFLEPCRLVMCLMSEELL
jgi:hypothetical protein